jgi:hypothetical protein
VIFSYGRVKAYEVRDILEMRDILGETSRESEPDVFQEERHEEMDQPAFN